MRNVLNVYREIINAATGRSGIGVTIRAPLQDNQSIFNAFLILYGDITQTFVIWIVLILKIINNL